MLIQSGSTTWVGGNIGWPLLEEVDQIRPEHRVVLDLCSLQLEGLSASAQVAVLLNPTADHLDRHPSFAACCQAELSILRHRREHQVAVLNRDDPEVVRLAVATSARRLWFTRRGELTGDGGLLRAGTLWLRLEGQEWPVCRTAELKLRGQHNRANALAAATRTCRRPDRVVSAPGPPSNSAG